MSLRKESSQIYSASNIRRNPLGERSCVSLIEWKNDLPLLSLINIFREHALRSFAIYTIAGR
jgi:hypothetical protein